MHCSGSTSCDALFWINLLWCIVLDQPLVMQCSGSTSCDALFWIIWSCLRIWGLQTALCCSNPIESWQPNIQSLNRSCCLNGFWSLKSIKDCSARNGQHCPLWLHVQNLATLPSYWIIQWLITIGIQSVTQIYSWTGFWYYNLNDATFRLFYLSLILSGFLGIHPYNEIIQSENQGVLISFTWKYIMDSRFLKNLVY